MALTIGPVVYGTGHHLRGLASFVLATLAGGLLVGVALAAIGQLAPLIGLVVVGLALVALAGYIITARIRIPSPAQQMPQTWINVARPIRTVAHYGFVQGLAFATPLRSASLVAIAGLAIVGSDPVYGAQTFAFVALIRALPVIVTVVTPRFVTEPASVVEEWVRHRHAIQLLDAAAVSLLAGALARQVIQGSLLWN
jgi:hypothetical protein